MELWKRIAKLYNPSAGNHLPPQRISLEWSIGSLHESSNKFKVCFFFSNGIFVSNNYVILI